MWQVVLQKQAAVQDQARSGQLSHLMGSSSHYLWACDFPQKPNTFDPFPGLPAPPLTGLSQPNLYSFTPAAFGSDLQQSLPQSRYEPLQIPSTILSSYSGPAMLS